MSNPLYFGGMILGRIEDAYAYEDWLAAFVKSRNAMFEDKNTFWGRNRMNLFLLERQMKFPQKAYYYIPEDPLVHIPQVDSGVVLLKRRYLMQLRRKFMKLMRQRKGISFYSV